MISRRGFLAGSVMLLAAPLGAGAQPPATKPYRVGLLLYGDPQVIPYAGLLRDRLRELGYREGQDIVFEERRAMVSSDQLPGLAADLVRSRVDLIVTGLDPETRAARRATDSIPIVVLASTDPVGNGFVASLNRPGGNVTGLTYDAGLQVAGKRIEILKEAIPKLKSVGFFFNPEFPGFGAYLRVWKATTASIGLKFEAFEARESKEFPAAFAPIKQARPGALFVAGGWPYGIDQRQRIVDFTIESRLPTTFVTSIWLKLGGLMAYLPSEEDRARRGAVFVDKILKGARPGDLPVEQPTKFELIINLKTAKAIGLTIPPSLLRRADQVIDAPRPPPHLWPLRARFRAREVAG